LTQKRLSSIEYHEGKWSLYSYDDDKLQHTMENHIEEEIESLKSIDAFIEKTPKELFENISEGMLKTSV